MEDTVDDPNNVSDIEFVEVRNWKADCSGGLQTSDVEVATVFAQVSGVIEKFGWPIAASHDAYF